MIESNGFGCNGVNPVANLEFLTEPSEAHFTKLPGIASASRFSPFRCEEDEWAVKICLDRQREKQEEGEEGRFPVESFVEKEARILLSLIAEVR